MILSGLCRIYHPSGSSFDLKTESNYSSSVEQNFGVNQCFTVLQVYVIKIKWYYTVFLTSFFVISQGDVCKLQKLIFATQHCNATVRLPRLIIFENCKVFDGAQVRFEIISNFTKYSAVAKAAVVSGVSKC